MLSTGEVYLKLTLFKFGSLIKFVVSAIPTPAYTIVYFFIVSVYEHMIMRHYSGSFSYFC